MRCDAAAGTRPDVGIIDLRWSVSTFADGIAVANDTDYGLPLVRSASDDEIDRGRHDHPVRGRTWRPPPIPTPSEQQAESEDRAHSVDHVTPASRPASATTPIIDHAHNIRSKGFRTPRTPSDDDWLDHDHHDAESPAGPPNRSSAPACERARADRARAAFVGFAAHPTCCVPSATPPTASSKNALSHGDR